jgi:hypothetical protein
VILLAVIPLVLVATFLMIDGLAGLLEAWRDSVD